MKALYIIIRKLCVKKVYVYAVIEVSVGSDKKMPPCVVAEGLAAANEHENGLAARFEIECSEQSAAVVSILYAKRSG